MATTQIHGKSPNISGVSSSDIKACQRAAAKENNSVYATVNKGYQSAKSKISSPSVNMKAYALFENESDQCFAWPERHVLIDNKIRFKRIDKKYIPDRTPYEAHFAKGPHIVSPQAVVTNVAVLQRELAAFIQSEPEALFAQLTYNEADLLSFSYKEQKGLIGQLSAMKYRSFVDIKEQIAKKMSSLPMALKIVKQAKNVEEFEKARAMIKEVKFWMVAFNTRFNIELQLQSGRVQSCDDEIALANRLNAKVEKSQKERSEQLNGNYDDLLKEYIAHRKTYSATLAQLNKALDMQFVQPVEKGQSVKARTEAQMDIVQSHINILQLTLLPEEQKQEFSALHAALKMLQIEIGKIKPVIQEAKFTLAKDSTVHAVFATLVETHAQALRLIAKANSLLPSRLEVQETLVGYFMPEDYNVSIKNKVQNLEAEMMLADEVNLLKSKQQRPDVRYKAVVSERYAGQGVKVNDRGGLSLRDYMSQQKLERMQQHKEGMAA